MVLANHDTFAINILFLKSDSSDDGLALLYFTGEDTYNKRGILKQLGFIFGTSVYDRAFYDVPIRSVADNTWHLLLPVSSIAAKIDLIRMHFPTITIIKQ